MKKGDLVICLDGSKRQGFDYKEFQNWIIEGHKYTIRRIEDIPNVATRVLLEEIKNKPTFFPLIHGKCEPAFADKRFMLHSDYIKRLEQETEEIDYLRIAEWTF